MAFHGPVEKEHKRYRGMDANSFYNLGLNPGTPCFVPNICRLSGEMIRVFRVSLTGDEFYVISGYLLLYKKDTIRIYVYDDELNFTGVRRINNHLLIFLVKNKAMNRRCRFLFYNILLHLMKNSEKRYDTKLRDIICYMCVDWLVDVEFCGEGVKCLYRNGESRFYNNRLQITSPVGSARKGYESVPTDGIHKVRVSKNSIEITHKDKAFRDFLSIERIKQHVALGNKLFLLTDDSVKILSFED